MKCSCSATSSFQSLNQIKPKEALYRELQVAFCKLFIQCLHNGVCCQNSCKMHHFTPVFFYSRRIPHRTMACKLLKMKALFFLSRKTILAKRVMQIHLVRLTIPLNSWMRHRLSQHWSTLYYAGSPLFHVVSVVRRQVQKCFLIDAPFWWYCVVVRYSQKNRDRSNATLWTTPISNRLLWTPCCFEPKWISWFCQCTFSYYLWVILTSVIGNSPLFRTGLWVAIVCTTSCLRYLDCARSYLLVFLLVILDCFVPVLLVPLMETRNSLRWQGLFI